LQRRTRRGQLTGGAYHLDPLHGGRKDTKRFESNSRRKAILPLLSLFLTRR
jgi:hypothetical protein